MGLQELGPRFTLKLRSIQRGTFDSKFGEYEWIHKVWLSILRGGAVTALLRIDEEEPTLRGHCKKFAEAFGLTKCVCILPHALQTNSAMLIRLRSFEPNSGLFMRG